MVIAINSLPKQERDAIIKARQEAKASPLSMRFDARVGQLNRLRKLYQAPVLGPNSLKAIKVSMR